MSAFQISVLAGGIIYGSAIFWAAKVMLRDLHPIDVLVLLFALAAIGVPEIRWCR